MTVLQFPQPKGDWMALTEPPEVMPVGDLREHDEGMGCWCKPFIEDEIIIHNAMDRRELYETGELMPQ